MSSLKRKVKVINVKPLMSDEDAEKLIGKGISRNQIKLIVDEDCDVYSNVPGSSPKLLLKFRKRVLSQKNIKSFYDATYKIANKKVRARPKTAGDMTGKTSVKSNIIGYFDKFSIKQKQRLKTKGLRVLNIPLVRETIFMITNPDDMTKALPLIEEISNKFKLIAPKEYKITERYAKQTFLRLGKSVFSTVTLNINFRTFVHKDSGDLAESLGNLAVIEKGKYRGAETCFPQYGIGVNVRHGDILLMDVHQPHGNLPFEPLTKDAERFSIVCYMRENLVKLTRGLSKTNTFALLQQNRRLLDKDDDTKTVKITMDVLKKLQKEKK